MRVNWRHPLSRAAMVSAAVLTLLAAVAVWYGNSDSFQQTLRRRVIQGIEQATGARVEIQSLHVSPWHFTFEAHNITLHGREPQGAAPFAHVDAMHGTARLLTLLGNPRAVLESLVIEHPEVSVAMLPDGKTNIPVPPPAPAESFGAKVQTLFDTLVGDLQVRNGNLHWSNRNIPLNFSAQQVAAELTRSLTDSTFTGHIAASLSEGKSLVGEPLHGDMDARFTIASSEVRVDSLQLRTALTSIAFTGVVDHWESPQFDGKYEGTVSLKDIGLGAADPKLVNGAFALKGNFHVAADAQTSEGTLALRDLDWRGDGADLNAVNATTQYLFDGERVRISSLAGSGHGGTVTGSGEVLLTGHSTRAADRGRPAGSGFMHLLVHGVPLREVLVLLRQGDTVAARHLSSNLSGKVEVNWLDPHHGLVGLNLDAVTPAVVPPGTVPLAGHAIGSATLDGIISADTLTLNSPQGHLTAHGSYGRPEGLTFELQEQQIGELHDILAALGWVGPPPAPGSQQAIAAGAPDAARLAESVTGSAVFTGNLSGSIPTIPTTPAPAPTITGRVQAQDVEITFPVANPSSSSLSSQPSSPEIDPRHLHLDTVSGDLRFDGASFSLAKGAARAGAASLAFSGSMPLNGGHLDRSGPVALHVTLDHAPLESLSPLLGRSLDPGFPISGVLSAQLDVSGSMNALQGGGTTELVAGGVGGIPIPRASAAIHVAGRALRLQQIEIATLGGAITGEFTYALPSGPMSFDLRGTGLDATQIPAMNRLPLQPSGTLDFSAQGSGTLAAPELRADLHLHGLSLNEERVGEFEATITPSGGRWKIDGKSRFEKSELSIHGLVTPHSSWASHMEVRFGGVDIDPLLRTYVPNGLTGHSSVGGQFTLDGPLADPTAMVAEGKIEQLSAEIENINLQSDGPLVFHLQDGRLQLEHARMTGEGSNLSAQGTVDLRGRREMNLQAEGQVNLHLLEAFYPELRSTGVVSANLRVGGTVDTPVLQGRMQVTDANLSYSDLPSGLSHIQGSLIFTQDKLQVESLTAQTGAGEVRLGGEIAYSHGLDFNLTATGKDVRLRYPPGLSATADAELKMTGTPANSTLAGRVTITRLSVSPRFDLGLYLSKAKQSTATPNTPITGLKLNIRLSTVPELAFETGLGKLTGDADLRIQGTAGHPAVLGRISIVQGDIEIAGTTYRIDHGELAFNNPVRIEPVFDLSASARVRDYDISLGLHGTPDKLAVNYRSDPPLPTSDIIALLALGRTRQDTGIASNQTLSLQQTTTDAILEEARNAAVSSRSQKLFGVARIKIDPSAGDIEGTTPGARVTIEQQISNRLTLTYITNVSQTQQQVIQVEYNLTRNVSLVGLRDANSVVGFDVRIRHRRK